MDDDKIDIGELICKMIPFLILSIMEGSLGVILILLFISLFLA